MPSDYARRGRPKGTGLDDRVQLQRIAELMEADPALKPTTAIKAAGVSDPSAIRRLRDKLKAQAFDEAGAASSAGWPAGGGVVASVCLEARGVSAATGRQSSGVTDGGLLEAAPAAGPDPAISWFTRWYALGLSAVSSTFEAQLAMMDDFFSVPQVASALRHQLLVNEAAKAFCPTRSDVRATLH